MTKNKNKNRNADRAKENQPKNAMLLYLHEISKIPLLSKEEEEKLATLSANGNAAARERLINANLRFVITIAKKYQGNGLPLEDLVSEGNLGLINAVKHYDVEKGFRFITYAVWWIRQSIIKAIQEKGRMIRLPSNKINELAKIEKARQLIQNDPNWKSGREVQEISSFLNMPLKKTTELMQICQDIASIDDETSSENNLQSVKDIIEDNSSKTPVDNAINSLLKDELEQAINGLEERDANVIRWRYGIGVPGPLTLKEIGANFQLSRERVRQIEKQSLGQLKQSPQKKRLKSYIA